MNVPPVKFTRIMQDILTNKSMEEDVSKLADVEGFPFNSLAKYYFIQTNLHRHRGKYDNSQPLFANGYGNELLHHQ